MRVLNSCLVLNNNRSRSFKIVWQKDSSLNCDFHKLFQPIVYFDIVFENEVLNYYSNYKPDHSPTIKGRVKKLKHAIINLKHNYYDDNRVQQHRFEDEYWLNLKNCLVIDTCHDFFTQEGKNNFYHNFKPVDSLQLRIDSLTRGFGKRTVGIHIRRTDNNESIEISKTDLFVEAIWELLAKDPNYTFYLSTDDIDTEEYFKKLFGERIIVNENKNLARDTEKGIQDALVDLYTLSKTDKILGSWWSSFSFIASELGQVPLQIIGK